MLERIFPKQFDNTYRGHLAAIWLLALVVLVKAIQGTQSIVNTRAVMTNADGLSLDSLSTANAETFMALFALLGLYLLVLPLQSLVVLIRYRAMIPFMYLMLLAIYGGGRLVYLLHPVTRADARPVGFYVNLAILAVTLIGFGLSLMNRPGAEKGS